MAGTVGRAEGSGGGGHGPSAGIGNGVLLAEALGGLLLVASMFGAWVGHGSGSSLSLHGVADLVLGGSLSRHVPRWLGLVGYLVPVSGALVVVAAGMRSRWRVPLLGCWLGLATLMVGTALIVTVAKGRAPGPGEIAAVVGVAVAVAGAIGERRTVGARATARLP